MNARQKAKHYKKLYEKYNPRNEQPQFELHHGEVVPVYAEYVVLKDKVDPARTTMDAENVERKIRNMALEKINEMIEIRTYDSGDLYRIIGGIKVIKE